MQESTRWGRVEQFFARQSEKIKSMKTAFAILIVVGLGWLVLTSAPPAEPPPAWLVAVLTAESPTAETEPGPSPTPSPIPHPSESQGEAP